MAHSKLPELYPEEQAMPLSKYYYNYPMKDLSDEVKAIIHGPAMNPADAIRPENFLDWLLPAGEYNNHENGCCMLEDGTGYIATYMRMPEGIDTKKIFWYLNWINFYSKSTVPGHGNLRYKIWNPADHWDHYYVNWKDASEGIFTTESLDLGESDRKYDTIRHPYNLRDYGLTDEKVAHLKASGCNVRETADWESFDEPGAHLTLGQIRPCRDGGFERRSIEWIGWRPENGRIVREPRTRCDEAYLRKVAQHTLIEWHHLMTFINELHAEYSVLPLDAD